MKQNFKVIGFFMPVLMLISTGSFADFYHRAPDVIPGTLLEMRNPSYWIARMEKPDEVILNLDKIRRMNKNFHKKMRAAEPFKDVPEERRSPFLYYWPGVVPTMPDLHSIKPEAVSDTVKKRIGDEIEFLRSRDFGNALGVVYADREIDALENEMALNHVKEKITIRDGIAVRCARLRSTPSFFPDQVGLLENGKTRWDLWNVGILKIGKPVIVLHRSGSGEYVFVLCEVGYGWVRSEDVAFAYKKEIDDFVNAKDFVICTGDRVQFYTDNSCMYASGWFRMGDCLPLAKKNNPRIIKVPVRKMNGKFTTETAWLAENADVHAGFLLYTRRNIVETAFKLLDNRYDFTGAWFGRNHETTYRDIFACFGFHLPYHGGLFTHFVDNETVLNPDVGREEQYRKILENEPFVTIQITLQNRSGHAQLLLGEYNGVPIVLDQHGYGYEGEDGTYYEIRRCCIGDVTQPNYFLKRKITFLELK